MSTAQRVPALESAFLALESRDVPFVFACILDLDRPVAVDALRSHVAGALENLPRYRQRIARDRLGRRVWVDDDFDIARHVAVTTVAAPGDAAALERLAAGLLADELPAHHAPWLLWTVNGLAGGRGAVVAVVHHALVDGVAGVRLLEQILGAATLDPAPLARPPRSRFATLREMMRWNNVAALARLLREGLVPASQLGINPRHTGRARAVATWTGRLADIKAIEHAFDVTNNDVVLAVVAGALERLVARRGVPLAGCDDVRVMVPVARHGEEHATSGNKVVLLLAPLPFGTSDPVVRLLRVNEAMRALKSGHRAGGGDLLVALSEATTPGILANVLRLALRMRAFNAIVTNVPGPRAHLSLLGARVTALVPIVNLWPHQALGIAVASYGGKISFGLQSDRAVISEHELQELRDDVRRELAVLVEEARHEHAA